MSLSKPKAFWPGDDATTSGIIRDTTGRGNNLTKFLKINPCTVQFRIGANSNGAGVGQQALASMKGWGKWNRLLTSGEKAALAGGEYYPFATTPTLLNGLTAYYLLDEPSASVTYADATGRGNDLTATGTTEQVTGPGGGADKGTKLTAGVYLTKASPGTDLQSSQTDTTICGFVRIDTKDNGAGGGLKQQVLWGQLDNQAGISGHNLYFEFTADRFCFDCDAGDGASLAQGSLVIDSVLGSPSTATWYHVMAELRASTTNTSAITIDNGTATTLSNILQPALSSGAQQFFLNPVASFAGPTSGWDADGTTPVNGNSNAYIAPNADVSFGNNSKALWFWLKSTDNTTLQSVMGFYEGEASGGPHLDHEIQIAANKLYFVFGAEQAYVTVDLTDTNSHLYLAWYDKVANKIKILRDNTAVVDATEATGPTTPQITANNFKVGSDDNHIRSGGASDHQFVGLWGKAGIADGIPSQADADRLWNNGDGWVYTVPVLALASPTATVAVGASVAALDGVTDTDADVSDTHSASILIDDVTVLSLVSVPSGWQWNVSPAGSYETTAPKTPAQIQADLRAMLFHGERAEEATIIVAVDDGNGGTDSDTVTVTVTAAAGGARKALMFGFAFGFDGRN